MANKPSILNISKSMKEIQHKNNIGQQPEEKPEANTQQQEPIGERATPVRSNVGRKPKERKIRRDYPKTIYFDEPTSMKLSDVRTKDKIEIKDLVLVATIEFLNRNFNNETRSLDEAAKNYIRKEMDRILDTFSE